MHSIVAENVKDNSFYQYTSGRWLWNETDQFSRRYVRFNITELARIAAKAVGSASCVEIKKLPEGNFNKVFLLSMSNGKEVIAKIPNPNAGRPYFSTASEVATMDFARNVLRIPSPDIYDWNANANNPVNAEYIIMEKLPGIELGKFWPELKGRQKYEIVRQIVEYEKSFASNPFSMFGSLYYASSLPTAMRTDPASDNDLAANMSSFAIGPTNNRMFFDDGRGDLDLDRGPWKTIEEYFTAMASREVTSIKQLKTFPQGQGLFYGPGQYQPSSFSKLFALKNYLKIVPHILPKEPSFRTSVMWHGDLHTDNIFVDPENPTRIVGIIDWQSVHLSPLFFQVRHPALIDFNGPIQHGFNNMQLPENFEEMSPQDKKDALSLRSAQSLWKLYEIELRQRSRDIFDALDYQNSLQCQINGLAGSIFTDGEPVINGMLITLEENWPDIMGELPDGQPAVPFPLNISSEEKVTQRADEKLWESGVELKDQILQELGVHNGWDGWVNHMDYEQMKDKLQRCLEAFLSRVAKTEKDRAEWMKVWPFADQ